MPIINRGKFITFEGGEGCGKSTQSKMLYHYLLSKNIPVDLTREVGGTPPAEKMREILLYHELLPMSELLQIMAARYEHMHQRIIPKLNSGSWVICDRFVDSTACYQGQNILDKILIKSPYSSKKKEKASGIDLVYNLHESFISFMPDCTFWIDVKPEIALSRALKRGDNNKFEDKEIDFHQKVYTGFQYISAKFFKRIVKISALTLSAEEIHDIIIKYCNQRFMVS